MGLFEPFFLKKENYFSKGIILFLILILPIFSKDRPEKIKIDRVIIHRNPIELPGVFTESLIPQNSKILLGTEFAKTMIDSLTDSSESVLIIENSESLEKLSEFYEKFFKENDWKVLQKDIREDKIIFLTESNTRRTLGVLIKTDNGKSKIKLFHRRNYSL
ncbi:MAG: hypothetical protein KDK36_05395 [Leptospiraceae bacterium]|nr:hypothetical protein [Leptospiraceae bacterium]